jgi:hypothetical protein
VIAGKGNTADFKWMEILELAARFVVMEFAYGRTFACEIGTSRTKGYRWPTSTRAFSARGRRLRNPSAPD